MLTVRTVADIDGNVMDGVIARVGDGRIGIKILGHPPISEAHREALVEALEDIL
jgi:hypothetical protein